jgi:lysophospholipase L1-like esterase
MNPNRNWRVVVLLSLCFVIYLFSSVIMYVFNIKWKPLQNVNLLSEIIHPEKLNDSNLQGDSLGQLASGHANRAKDFELYKKPDLITDFTKGDSITALMNFSEKLAQLKKTKKGKIRIAYFGDSMIEGDLLTRKLRKLLQSEFGGSGVGYLPIQSKVAPIRESSEIKAAGWKTINFMDKEARNMYVSGFSFSGTGNSHFTDKTLASGTITSKFLIFGQPRGSASINYNGANLMLNGMRPVNRQLLAKDTVRSYSFKSNTPSVPYYGVSFESDNGIIVDNFSFRGITGVEFKKIDEDFLKAVQAENHYDLVVMQYGVNLLFRPDDTDYSYYVKVMTPTLVKFKSAFPKTDILMVSTADRAFRYNGEFQSAKGVRNLVETQAKMAYDNNFSFFNLFETMGGENSIVAWAQKDPPLANKDYVHPNGKGTDILAEKLYHAMMKDYKNYTAKKRSVQ